MNSPASRAMSHGAAQQAGNVRQRRAHHRLFGREVFQRLAAGKGSVWLRSRGRASGTRPRPPRGPACGAPAGRPGNGCSSGAAARSRPVRAARRARGASPDAPARWRRRGRGPPARRSCPRARAVAPGCVPAAVRPQGSRGIAPSPVRERTGRCPPNWARNARSACTIRWLCQSAGPAARTRSATSSSCRSMAWATNSCCEERLHAVVDDEARMQAIDERQGRRGAQPCHPVALHLLEQQVADQPLPASPLRGVPTRIPAAALRAQHEHAVGLLRTLQAWRPFGADRLLDIDHAMTMSQARHQVLRALERGVPGHGGKNEQRAVGAPHRRSSACEDVDEVGMAVP